jgi:hypothetical protein
MDSSKGLGLSGSGLAGSGEGVDVGDAWGETGAETGADRETQALSKVKQRKRPMYFMGKTFLESLKQIISKKENISKLNIYKKYKLNPGDQTLLF